VESSTDPAQCNSRIIDRTTDVVKALHTHASTHSSCFLGTAHMYAGQKGSLKNSARCFCPHCSEALSATGHTENVICFITLRTACMPAIRIHCLGMRMIVVCFRATCIHIYAWLCKCFALQLPNMAVCLQKSRHGGKYTSRVF